MSIYGILLAAGDSKRYGGDKLLEPLPDGKTIAENSGRILVASVDKAIAVVRNHDSILAHKLEAIGLEVLCCHDSHFGMGASLSMAAEYAQDAKGLVVALADMPFIQKNTMDKVVRLLSQEKVIVAPSYKGKRGHPVGFNAVFRKELCSLQGDEGARKMFDKYRAQGYIFDCDDPGVLVDIDTQDDYKSVMPTIFERL